jgi:hypothetical protein
VVSGVGGLYQAGHYMFAWTKRCIRQVRVVGEGVCIKQATICLRGPRDVYDR